MHFPTIYSIQNLDTFWPSGPTMAGIQVKLKPMKFYRNFSWCNFEKLWLKFPKWEKAIVEQILVSEEREKSKSVELWEDLGRKVNHMSKVIWDKKNITEFTRSISSTRIDEPVLMMKVRVSKDKHISRWVDWENLICIRWNRIKNSA